MKSFLCLITLAASLALLPQSGSFAQEASDEKPQQKATEEEPKADVADQAVEEDPEIPPATAIRDLIRKRQLKEAAETLEAAIGDDPDNDDLHDLRDTLAQSFLMTRKYDESFEQLKTSFEHRIANADNARNQARLAMTVSLLRMAALRKGEPAVADESIDRAIDAIDANDLGVVSIQTLSTLIPQKAMQMATSNDVAGANDLLDERIDRIGSVDARGSMKESLVTAKSRFLFAKATLPEATDDAKSQLDDFILDALDEFPESRAIASEFSRIQTSFVARTYRDDPEAARDRLDRAVEIMEKMAEEDNSLRYLLSRLKSYEPRIASALRLKELIGEQAPEWEIAAWVNQGDVSEDSLEGKVVLLDFWSVWCGPCIATFPHLREWYDEFHDQGFEIVGVTRYYGYTWDDEANRAVRSKEDVEPDDENLVLEQFMNHHELRHPTIVTPKESEMQKAYAVTGIPHAVLIDRKGYIQMIKVGSGSDNAEQLHAKIKELIAE